MPRPRRIGPRIPDPSRAPARTGFAQLRRKHLLTQDDLGAAVGVDRSAISKIEHGQRHPSQELLVRLASVLNTAESRLEELLYGPDKVRKAGRPA